MFKITCLLLSLTFTFCFAAEYDHPQTNSAAARILDYQFDNIGTGPYRFAFASSDGIERREEGNLINPNTEDEALVVVGSYSYIGPDGVTYTVKYTADQNGFHPEGDHISVPPFVPWVKGQHDSDESGHYHLKSSTQKPIIPLYLPVTPRPAFSSPLPIIVNGNSQNPILTQYISSTPRPLINSLSPILSSTPKPAFNIFNDQPSLIAYVPTRRDTGSDTKKSARTKSSSASNILDILGTNDKEDNANPVQIEDINSL
ncbi:hypothetical protein ILUMI_05690 [Ignelater luminosus]|uniref:Uncharacterized protein n=1 Tax=Ignelater luminosus TaxID=2038154 RepID=A0A8K0D6N8_IGNLU|nr:hypothetical protein ILUMI_05690 [Ignelater luminosus]